MFIDSVLPCLHTRRHTHKLQKLCSDLGVDSSVFTVEELRGCPIVLLGAVSHLTSTKHFHSNTSSISVPKDCKTSWSVF